MLDFITKLKEITLFWSFWIKISHSDIKSPFSVTFIKWIVIILFNF